MVGPPAQGALGARDGLESGAATFAGASSSSLVQEDTVYGGTTRTGRAWREGWARVGCGDLRRSLQFIARVYTESLCWRRTKSYNGHANQQ